VVDLSISRAAGFHWRAPPPSAYHVLQSPRLALLARVCLRGWVAVHNRALTPAAWLDAVVETGVALVQRAVWSLWRAALQSAAVASRTRGLESEMRLERLEMAAGDLHTRWRRRTSMQQEFLTAGSRPRLRASLGPAHIFLRWAVFARRRRWAGDRCAPRFMLYRSLSWRNSWVCWLAWRLLAGRSSGLSGALLQHTGASIRLLDRLISLARLGPPGIPSERSLEVGCLDVLWVRPPEEHNLGGYEVLLLRTCVRGWVMERRWQKKRNRRTVCRKDPPELDLGLQMSWLLWNSVVAAQGRAALFACKQAELQRLRRRVAEAPQRAALQEVLLAWRSLLVR